ncbi:MAG: hypothetical protein ACXW4Q_01010 [Anaerolineales bacterium]
MLYWRAMNILRSLEHRPFALLWTGQTTSRLGDSLYRIALAWWVLEMTGSAVAMGTVLVFSQIPLLLFLLIGGAAVAVCRASALCLFQTYWVGWAQWHWRCLVCFILQSAAWIEP